MTIGDRLQCALDVDRSVKSWGVRTPKNSGVVHYLINGRLYTQEQAAEKWCVSDLFDPQYPKTLHGSQAERIAK